MKRIICAVLLSILLAGVLAAPVMAATQVFCVSRVVEEFNGWDGETIFKLDNGTVWEQAEYYYQYRYAYRPEVTIFIKSGFYYALVDGIDKLVRVERLR